jgi:small neutral amino acid transporter SnatA (MarC family)
VTDFMRIAATLFVAISPAAAAVAAGRPGLHIPPRSVMAAAGVAMAIYAIGGLGAGRLLDAIDIEPETFRVSAGLVMAVGGAFAIWMGTAGYSGELDARAGALFPLALPILVTPAGVAALLSHSADGDTGMAVGAALAVVVLATVAITARLGRFSAAADAITRMSGLLLIAFAGAMIVDGVRAV